MMTNQKFNIVVLPGDGIGNEIMGPCVVLLKQLQQQMGGFQLEFDVHSSGAEHYRVNGESISAATMAAVREADAILLGAMGLPSIRYPNGTEIAPQLELREQLNLYAGVRPVRKLPGLMGPLRDARAERLDFVIVRESTEGLFAARGKTVFEGTRRALDTMVISRDTCERLFDHAFELARQRKADGFEGRVTCVDKANVLGSFAFFRGIFFERAERYPDIVATAEYVDAVGLNLVRKPWVYDVLVTENMFGDILSDVSAALVGGMGMAPSADIGSDHAVFQPAHGSAPDIAGQGIANPTAMVLSAAMMLDWLGRSHANQSLVLAGKALQAATAAVFASGGCLPSEFGGNSSTQDIADAIARQLDHAGIKEPA